MPRGLPDDSNVVKEAPVYGLSDMAELAARLGSPINYIRYGDVVMLDDFESGRQAWTAVLPGGGSSARLTGTYTRSRGVAVHLDSGDGADPTASLQRNMPMPESSKVGFGCSFMIAAGVVWVMFGVVATIDELNYAFYIRYNTTTHNLDADDDVGGWGTFANVQLRENLWPFHLCKLVVNLTTREYVRFYLDDSSWLLTGLQGVVTDAAGQANLLNVMVSVDGNGVAAGHLYVDDCVATQNEF